MSILFYTFTLIQLQSTTLIKAKSKILSEHFEIIKWHVNALTQDVEMLT